MAWHSVAGLALYGDIEAAIASGEFVPSLFLCIWAGVQP